MTDPVRVAIIEDEVPIRRFLEAAFDPSAFECSEAESGQAGIRLVAQKNPHVVLLDLGLPDMDGIEVIRRLREWSDVPILVLTARGMERDKVLALDAGADDYMTKPFSVNELMARIRVALRHRQASTDSPAAYDGKGLRLDFEARRAWVDHVEVRLTPIEFRLLSFLARHAGKVLTHRQLIEEVWGPAYLDSTHMLRVHMSSIRQKIEPKPGHPRFIRTETGVGYRLLGE